MVRPTFNLYDVGDPVRITIQTVDRNQVLADPTTLSLDILTPAKVKTTYVYGVAAALVRLSTGTYEFVYTPALSGDYWYRWESTGTITSGQEEHRFRVRNQVVV